MYPVAVPTRFTLPSATPDAVKLPVLIPAGIATFAGAAVACGSVIRPVRLAVSTGDGVAAAPSTGSNRSWMSLNVVNVGVSVDAPQQAFDPPVVRKARSGFQPSHVAVFFGGRVFPLCQIR